MVFDTRIAATLAALLALAGCSTDATTVPPPVTAPLNFTTSAGPDAPGGNRPGYVLSEDEKGYDCKKLTGKIQLRILDMRGYESRDKTTIASRGLHTAGKMVFGGTNAGLNTDAQFAKDKAMLDAYNTELVTQDCRSFNIAEALAGSGVPSPTIDAPSKAKAKAAAQKKP